MSFWFPRWFIVSSIFPLFLGVHIGLGLLIWYFSKNVTVAVIVAIASFLSYVIGTIYAQKFREDFVWLRVTTPELDGSAFAEVFWSSQKDLIAFFCFLLTLVMIIRIPGLIVAFSRQEKESRRKIFYYQFFMSFVDWFSLYPFLNFLIMPWRIPKLYGKIKEETKGDIREVFDSLPVRGFVFYEFFQGIVDIFVFVFILSFTLILAPWRLVTLFEKVSEKDTIGKKRSAIWLQFGNALLDFGCLLLALFVCCFIYRIPSLLYYLYKNVYIYNLLVTRNLLFIF